MKRALITGALGQDGSYMAELLLSKGYKVFGMIPQRNIQNWKNKVEGVEYIVGDITDPNSVTKIFQKTNPHEIYNFAALSFVSPSWKMPELYFKVNTLGLLNLLEESRFWGTNIKLYQASSSEMYGNAYPQYNPVSPYGISKLASHNLIINYRESYGLKCFDGILFNHESPRRGEHFVTQKIAKAVARIKLGLQDNLELGNINSQRDIGFAGDYIKAIKLIMDTENTDSLEICTGETHSIKEMLDVCFDHVGLSWEAFVSCDNADFNRPVELNVLRGNALGALEILDWKAEKTWIDVLKEMVDYQLMKNQENL